MIHSKGLLEDVFTHKKLVSTTTIRFGFYYYHLLSRPGGFCEGPPPKKKAPNDAGPPLPSLGVPSTCRFLSFRKSRSAFSDSDFKTFSRSSNGNVSKANADSMISRGSISCGSQLSKIKEPMRLIFRAVASEEGWPRRSSSSSSSCSSSSSSSSESLADERWLLRRAAPPGTNRSRNLPTVGLPGPVSFPSECSFPPRPRDRERPFGLFSPFL